MTIYLYANFKEGAMRIEPATCVINQAICNDALQHVENSASLDIVYEEEFFSKLLTNEKFNANITDGAGKVLFTGEVAVDTSWQDVGSPYPIDKISLTVKDYTQVLRKKTNKEIALVNTNFSNVINKLVGDCGLNIKGEVPFIPIPYFVVQKNRSYLSLLDSFCFQYGLVFYFDSLGFIRLFNFSNVPVNPESISDADILAPLRIKKSQKKYNSVTVNYNTLTTKTNELIFRESPKYDSHDQPLPIIVQPGVYYPFESSPIIESEEGVVEQSFSSGFAESKKKFNGEISFQRSKNTSLFYTTNHHVVKDWEGDIEIDRTNFSSLGASLRLKNTGSTDAKIWQFAIRADAVYRNATASVSAGDVSSGEVYTIDSEFIFDSDKATELAKTLYKYSTFNNYKIDFSLDNEKMKAGCFKQIKAGTSGFMCDALITSCTFDASKDLYLYKAVSVSQATVDISKKKEVATSDIAIKGDKGSQGLPGKDGKDGTTKFLTSLNIHGDFENQIGTFQGQLYRWENSSWILLNAVMPLNPVAYYDFDEVSKIYDENIIYNISKPLLQKKYSQILRMKIPKGSYILKSSSTFTGNANPALEIYNSDWSDLLLYKSLNNNQTVYFRIPNDDYYLGIWMQGNGGYQPTSEDSVTINKFVIAKIPNLMLDKIEGENNLKLNNSHRVTYSLLNNVSGASIDYMGFLKSEKKFQGENHSISLWIKPDAILEQFHHLFSFQELLPYVRKTNSSSLHLKCYGVSDKNHQLKEGELIHLVFSFSKEKLKIYINGVLVENSVIQNNSQAKNLYLGTWHDSYGFYNGWMGQVLIFDRLLTEQEVLWLYLNPQYPVKNYSHADWALDEANPDNALAKRTPKYLGTVATVPTTRTATITKGELLGAVDSNVGDWVLMTENIDGWQMGICYKWSGTDWEETQAPQSTVAALQDALELCKSVGKDENIPAVSFTKKMIALDAFIENLSAQVVYFQKSVASLVSNNPQVGDQMIYMGHNYRQYNPNDPFEFGIDELSYKDYNNNIEVWRKLMNTKQIKNIAGASILSLFLTGCIQANGGVECPPVGTHSINKFEKEFCSINVLSSSENGKYTVAACSEYDHTGNFKKSFFIKSVDKGKTFRICNFANNFTPFVFITSYRNKFYAMKMNTTELWVTSDLENWQKDTEFQIPAKVNTPNKWYCNNVSSKKLVISNSSTSERIVLAGGVSDNNEPPPDGDKSLTIVKSNKITLAYNFKKTNTPILIKRDGESWRNSLMTGVDSYAIIDKIDVLNGVFYAMIDKILYSSINGDSWAKLEGFSYIEGFAVGKEQLLILDQEANEAHYLLIKNDKGDLIVKITLNGFLDRTRFVYSEELNSFYIAGSTFSEDYSFLYFIPKTIKTGSGITELEANNDRLVAKFGNGLQVATYANNNSKPDFAGKEWTFSSGQNKLTIGKWF